MDSQSGEFDASQSLLELLGALYRVMDRVRAGQPCFSLSDLSYECLQHDYKHCLPGSVMPWHLSGVRRS
jgi:hypothetical protein